MQGFVLLETFGQQSIINIFHVHMGYEKGKISHFDSTLPAAGLKQKAVYVS